jgi:glycosyltransferase involved in cell wall biosynthesis
MLQSLCEQTFMIHEVIVADGSASEETAAVVVDRCWRQASLRVNRVAVQPPNAVRQRAAAIAEASGEYLLLLDDDVVLEPHCVKEMLQAIAPADVVAVTADFNNQAWSGPTTLWRWYLRWCCGVVDGEWQGRVIGPLLRFGYRPVPVQLAPMEWIGAGNSLVRRTAYDRAGGFSDFFLHRSTINEDVDLGLKLGRLGRILLCPAARLAHLHAQGGTVSAGLAAEDDMYNRYLILRRTQGRSAVAAFGLVFLYFAIETASNLGGCVRRFRGNAFGERLAGRLRALARIMFISSPRRVTVP